MEESGEEDRGGGARGAGEGGGGVVEVRYDLSEKYPGGDEGTGVVGLRVCDHLLVGTVVIVNVVGFWRGLFGILSQFEDLYQLCFVYLLGSVILCHFTIARNAYKRQLESETVWHGILRRGYTYIFGCACVAQWAGLWYFLDAMSGFDVYPPIAYSTICSAILIYIRLYRNILAPPITFCMDRVNDFFDFNTAFNLSPSNKVPPREPDPIAANPPFLPLGRGRRDEGSGRRMRRVAGGGDVRGGGVNRVVSVVDALLSGVVIAPAVVAYWRGSWWLSDFYVFPSELRVSLVASAVVGTAVQVALALAQGWLERRFGGEGVAFYVTSRLYTYVWSLASVNLWRGGWKALDLYSGMEPVRVAVPTAISLAALVGMRTMRNLSSAPLVVVLDTSPGYFRVPTMFKLTGTSATSLYVLDCFFSVFVVGSLVVFVWRGVWCLTDVFLYPENEKLSAFGSLGIGYGIVIVVFCMQIPMENFCEKLSGFWRLLVADVYVFVSFLGTINLWRGIWNLLNIYFLPESPVLSCWITHLGSFCVLVVLRCSNSTLVRGVYLDGEEGGKCVVFPISYLRLMFEKQLAEKTRSRVKHKTGGMNGTSDDAEKGLKEAPENGKALPRSADSS